MLLKIFAKNAEPNSLVSIELKTVGYFERDLPLDTKIDSTALTSSGNVASWLNLASNKESNTKQAYCKFLFFTNPNYSGKSKLCSLAKSYNFLSNIEQNSKLRVKKKESKFNILPLVGLHFKWMRPQGHLREMEKLYPNLFLIYKPHSSCIYLSNWPMGRR